MTIETLQERAKQIQCLRVLEGHTYHVSSVCFSPDTRLLASGSNDHTVRLWEVATGRQMRTLEGHTHWVKSVNFSPDGRLLASGSFDKNIFLWEVETGRQLHILKGHSHRVQELCFAPDGRLLASASSDHTIRLWDPATAKCARLLTGHTSIVYSLCFSPDGSFLASASADRTVRLWNVKSGLQLREFSGHTLAAYGVCFSPDGEWLASCSEDKTIRLWNVRTGQPLHELTGHTNRVEDVCFSLDGRFILSGSWDATIRLWEADTGRQICVLHDHSSDVRSIKFSSDGRLLVSGSYDYTIRIWDIAVLEAGPKPKRQSVPHRVTVSSVMRSFVDAHLRTLPLSHVVPPTSSRPAYWMREIGILGARMPLCAAQDLGALLTQPAERLLLERPAYLPEDLDTSAYLNFLRTLAEHPLLRKLGSWDISDAVAGVLLVKLTQGVEFSAEYALPGGTAAAEFARSLSAELDQDDPAWIWRTTRPAQRPDLKVLLSPPARTQIEKNLHCLDAAELHFLHRYGPRYAGAPDPRELLDLFTLLDLPPDVRHTLSQVLRLLPRVSQAVKTGGAQTYTMGGYEGLARTGNPDSLIPTELAYPDDIFYHRLLNHEALYYGREGSRERQRELAYIVTQAGLELLGESDLLARGLSFALAQTMQRRGYDVWQSFVGSACTPPSGMMAPAEVQRMLYYKDDGWLHPREMLEAVTGNLRCWAEQYRGMQVFWVLSEYWDADDWELHEELYQTLRRQAGHQVWFIQDRRKGNGSRPPAARQFHRYHLLNCAILQQKLEQALVDNWQPDVGIQQPVTEGGKQGDMWVEPLTGMEFVWISEGRFLMGSPEAEEGRHDDEGPQHEVAVNGFWLAKTQVTNAQYRVWKADHKSGEGFDGEQQPVVEVSWEDAQEFIAWLNEQHGGNFVFRLPSEAEWEYACRAGTTTPFYFGETIGTDQANYDGNYTYGSGKKGEYRRQTTDVGSFPPNAFDLYDMHGNVWEWCEDPWHDNYDGAPSDGSVWETRGGPDRVLRGGSWNLDPRYVRCAYRGHYSPQLRGDYIGFRLARTL